MPSTVLPNFYEVPRVPLPPAISQILRGNKIKAGAGKNDLFEVIGKDFISRTALTSSSVSLANGTQVMNQINTTSNQFPDKTLFAIVERATYVDSVAVANLLPGGTAIDETQWQIIGPQTSIVKIDGTDVNINEIANTLYVLNISAGTHTVIFQAYVRFITSRPNIETGGVGTGL